MKCASVSSSTSVSVICAVCDDGIGSYVLLCDGDGVSVSIEPAGALLMYDVSKEMVVSTKLRKRIHKSRKTSCVLDGCTAIYNDQTAKYFETLNTHPCR